MELDGQGAPSGAVTFLFSDVVGSGRLWAGDPEGMAASLRLHDDICRSAIAAHDGYVFSIAGDSFGAAFQDPADAVRCADRIQRDLAKAAWADGPAIAVRVGVHRGEADERDGNYFGPEVNLAARAMAVAHGGQAVLTGAVVDVASLDGIVVVDLGPHTLRDVSAPVRLHQLGETIFPPLAGSAAAAGLPSPRTSLVGREAAIDEVRALLAEHRLVTLTGIGGGGKTRLAVEVGHRELPAHPDGEWFVDLTTATDDAAVLGVVAGTLGLAPAPTAAAALDQLVDYLDPKRALVVLDNCEHVIAGVVAVVDELLTRCGRLQVLATSREALRCEGEHTWPVPSLATGADAPAAVLFRERAAAAGAVLADDDASGALIADIVERLDGLPLAIELAAARARSMDLAELHRRLDDRFRLLAGSRRHDRQATLAATVQWSYDLLTPAEQSMLQTLAVFHGGFAAEDVAGVAGITEADALDLIDALVAKSLIDVGRDAAGVLRHRLLETVRLFGLARLAESGRDEQVRDHHLDHFRHDEAGASFDAWTSFAAVRRAAREYENLRAAATWAVERGRDADAARIAVTAAEAATNRGEVGLVIDWLRRPTSLAPAEELVVASMLGWELVYGGALDEAEAPIARALALADVAPRDFVVQAMFTEATRRGLQGDFMGMVEMFFTAHQTAHAHYGPNVRGLSDFYLGWLGVLTFRYTEALAQFDVALAEAPDAGYRHIVEANRAWALLRLGHGEEAARQVEDFAEVPAGSQWEQLNLVIGHMVMAHTAGVELAGKSLATAARPLVARRPAVLAFVLSGFAYLAHLTGDDARAQEIVRSVVAADGEQIWGWVALAPTGATPDTFAEARERYEQEHPVTERAARQQLHGARLLAEELTRWE